MHYGGCFVTAANSSWLATTPKDRTLLSTATSLTKRPPFYQTETLLLLVHQAVVAAVPQPTNILEALCELSVIAALSLAHAHRTFERRFILIHSYIYLVVFRSKTSTN
jgi:hypothetical protein